MEFRIKRSELLRGLKIAAGIARGADRKTMPVLANVLLRARNGFVLIAATDLNVSLTAELECLCSSEGSITISAATLLETIANAPGDDVSLKKGDNHWAEIKSGKAKYGLAGASGDEFPKVDMAGKDGQSMSGPALAALIERVSFAASDDESRFAMCGAIMESNGKLARMVATSGYALAKADVATPCPEFGGRTIIIPSRGLAEIRKVCEVESVVVALAERQVFVSSQGLTVSSKLIDASPFGYEGVIPKGHKNVVTVNRETMLASIQRVRPMSSEDRGCGMEASKDGLVLSCVDAARGDARDEITAEYIGAPISIGFSPRIMAECLGHMVTDQVAIAMGTNVDPIIVRPMGDKTYTCIVMPMRL